METRKIAMACFVGGAIGCAIALWATPIFWWLGLLAGFAGGYVSFEFREVLEAVPVAFRAAAGESAKLWAKAEARAIGWLKQPHPFAYSTAAVGAVFYALLNIAALSPATMTAQIGAVVVSLYLAMILVAFLSLVGFSVERRGDDVSLARVLENDVSPYRHIALLMAKGLGLVILYVPVGLIVVGLWRLVPFLGRFAWEVVKLIHSKERMLCGVDSAIAAAVSYFLFAVSAETLASQVVLVIFGGVLGAALGVINFEIVSKRVLKLVPIATR